MTVRLFNASEGAARASRRIERKFYVAPRQIGIAQGLLRQVCRPDGEYSTCLVNSLYFDTFDLEGYHDSQSGDLDKEKVRIRWYGEDGGPGEARTIYVELKSKRGFVGIKQRLEMTVPGARLAMPDLARGVVSRATLSGVLSSFGHFPEKMLVPVVRITYRRYRFVEPLTGQRVALDCQIRSTMVGPGPGKGDAELELAGAVIEIKGASVELPVTLMRMGVLDVDWSRFSKYSACIDAHEERLGAIGRLSPSGRVSWPD
jgi:hypothetical protein